MVVFTVLLSTLGSWRYVCLFVAHIHEVYEVIFHALFYLILRLILRGSDKGDKEKWMDSRYIWIKKLTVFIDRIRLGKRKRMIPEFWLRQLIDKSISIIMFPSIIFADISIPLLLCKDSSQAKKSFSPLQKTGNFEASGLYRLRTLPINEIFLH